MLVIMTDNQLIAPRTVCQNCPMASQSGQPRWREGQLRCGRPIETAMKDRPMQYQCTMGFRVAELAD